MKKGIFFFPKILPTRAAPESENVSTNIPTKNDKIFSGNHIQDINVRDNGVIHIPIVILLIEKMLLNQGEYFPIHTPINKIIPDKINSVLFIKIGPKEKITPTST